MIDEEIEVDGDSELEDSVYDFLSLFFFDFEVEIDVIVVCSFCEIDSVINFIVLKVEFKDNKVDVMKDELVEFEKDEGVEDENIEMKYVSILGEYFLKFLVCFLNYFFYFILCFLLVDLSLIFFFVY